MVELFSIASILVVALCQVFLYICTTEYGTLVMVTVGGLPLLIWLQYKLSSRAAMLRFIDRDDAPLPPEIYYWALTRNQLWLSLRALFALVLVSWPITFIQLPQYPVAWNNVAGWGAFLVALGSTSRFLALGFLYILASQTMDRAMPGFIGALRRWLYRFTSNPDFL